MGLWEIVLQDCFWIIDSRHMLYNSYRHGFQKWIRPFWVRAKFYCLFFIVLHSFIYLKTENPYSCKHLRMFLNFDIEYEFNYNVFKIESTTHSKQTINNVFLSWTSMMTYDGFLSMYVWEREREREREKYLYWLDFLQDGLPTDL